MTGRSREVPKESKKFDERIRGAMEGEQVWEYKPRGFNEHNVVHFGLNGRQEQHDMKLDNFQLCKDNNGVEFVQFTEGQTKTRQGGLHTKLRDFQPRMFTLEEKEAQ